ncbi:MAG: FeoB small GTPase domain-containing protein [bacterium]
MGLTSNSSGHNVLNEKFNIKLNSDIPTIALAGNPNTGKSTVFNELTGLKQHTGNWPGKTVTRAQGFFRYQDQKYKIIDLPGTYSLLANSTEEKIARDFICFAKPEVTVIVTDATNLERNLNLVLQIIEITDNIIVCLNFMDEAKRKNIKIDLKGLKKDLSVPVIPTVARDNKGLDEIKEKIHQISQGNLKLKPKSIKYSTEVEKAIKNIKNILSSKFPDLENNINLRWLSLRLLEGDSSILTTIQQYYGNNIQKSLFKQPEGEVITDGVK